MCDFNTGGPGNDGLPKDPHAAQQGMRQREMERSKVASREKTKEVYEAADKLGLSWPLDDDITNAELEEILFPGKYKSGCRPYIHRELAKPGVSIALLWEEYCRKCHETGETPYMSTQFGDKYRRCYPGGLGGRYPSGV